MVADAARTRCSRQNAAQESCLSFFLQQTNQDVEKSIRISLNALWNRFPSSSQKNNILQWYSKGPRPRAPVSVIVHWPVSGVSRPFGGPSHAVSTILFFPDDRCIKEPCSSLSLGK
ncbi:hypothetical protein NXS19_012338 [Fusarium pseudograminearum]|nr:hypothetical protein NXS19_012338 [Fusarium pseudograminearum]